MTRCPVRSSPATDCAVRRQRNDLGFGGSAAHADQFRADAEALVIAGSILEDRAAELPADDRLLLRRELGDVGMRGERGEFRAQRKLLSQALKREQAMDDLIACFGQKQLRRLDDRRLDFFVAVARHELLKAAGKAD